MDIILKSVHFNSNVMLQIMSMLFIFKSVNTSHSCLQSNYHLVYVKYREVIRKKIEAHSYLIH